MKRAIFTSLVVGVVVTFAFVGCSDSKEKESVQMATETRAISGFKEIVLEGPGKLIIKQGERESLEIQAGEDIIRSITSNVSGEQLVVKTDTMTERAPGPEEIQMTITVKDINSVILRGDAMVKSQGTLNVDDLRVVIAGAGEADLDLKGDGLNVDIKGAGRVNVQGEVEEQTVMISGVGVYDGLKLKSEEATVNVSGAGSASVNVSKELNVKISGTGRVTYAGDPKVSQTISGRGRVSQVKSVAS